MTKGGTEQLQIMMVHGQPVQKVGQLMWRSSAKAICMAGTCGRARVRVVGAAYPAMVGWWLGMVTGALAHPPCAG